MNISSAQPYFESNSTSITFKDVPNPIANFFAMWFAHDDTALEINETIHKSRAFNAVSNGTASTSLAKQQLEYAPFDAPTKITQPAAARGNLTIQPISHNAPEFSVDHATHVGL
ncbi:MAG: hypothetical protein MMC23_001871 [Stictis urceolatum]|nr:hypothetical protein [Stictis urceolata]